MQQSLNSIPVSPASVFHSQVIFEGVHGSSRANGFVGIDDIAYFEGDCTSKFHFLLFGY